LARRRYVYNITFHGVGQPKTGPVDETAHFALRAHPDLWLTDDAFRKVLDELGGHEDVFLTFDDGYESNVTVVLPELRARGITAAFFVVGSAIGEPGFLTPTDVRLLADAGMIVGSHGLLHRSWTSLDDQALERDLRRSDEVITSAAGRPVDQVSCPWGHYDRRVLRRLKALGYTRVYTSDGVKAPRTAWLQGRTSIRKDDDAASVLSRLDRPRSLRGKLRHAVRSIALQSC
jgi:peptidoglycan/xylan/chitin deacetylase (PgdA/CDA1 family)